MHHDVITQVDADDVDDFNHLIMLLSRYPAGKSIRVTVERIDDRGKMRVIQLQPTLFKKHIDTLRPAYATVPDPSWRGLSVDYITAIPQSATMADPIDVDGCVVTTEVEPDSAAKKAGLGRRWFISKVDNKRVSTPAEFFKAVEKKTGAVRLDVSYATQAGPVSKVITVPAS